MRFLLILFTIILLLLTPARILAKPTTSGSLHYVENSIQNSYDYRVNALKYFFDQHNSPLSEYSGSFVYYADKYNLDWRLIPAISGVESTFGKNIPVNSFNAYGWSNGNYYFNSWEESIDYVSKTLKQKYIDDGLISVNQIARRYAPSSSSWAWKVRYFMNEIDPLPLEFTI